MTTRTDRHGVYGPDGALLSEVVQVVDTTAETNATTLRAQAATALAGLRVSVDTLQALADKTNATIGPADTKQVARELRRTNRTLIAVTRLVVSALESADTGTE